MISNQVLQNTIEGIKEISHLELGIMDSEGREVAVTAPVFAEASAVVPEFALSPADSQSAGPYQFFKVMDEAHLEYVIVVYGETDSSLLIGRMAAFQIRGLMSAFKERYDKDSFMKNLLLDNLLLVDIYSRAKKLRIPADAQRVVMIVEAGSERDRNILETVQEFAGATSTDFVTAVDENNVVIVKDLSDGSRSRDIEKAAAMIDAHLQKAGITGVRIAYGTVVNDIKEVSRSYKEAKMALDVSRIFFEDSRVIAYNELGIGRLIYQLPIPLCKMFIREIFKGKNPDEFDQETLATINKFFENSLNVSETSRQLFIHRNTLVYRLDKLQKSTGLDLRVFEEAITFKIALMVVKYMKYMEQYDF
ncbi:MAG: helix-turn-helix domain-containing protein [Lachnospiraceae bacterium]|nr:helix-turn-helix domain-containing protein [Lachnospiraceae bacterium]